MAGQAQLTVVYEAPLHTTSGAVDVGDVLIPEGVGSRYFVKATAAVRGTRRSHGIALVAGLAGGSVRIQDIGIVDREVANLGAGDSTYVRVSSLGRMERVDTPADDDDIIGTCDTEGTIVLSPMASATAATASVADDIDSTGSTIDRVIGINRQPLLQADGEPIEDGDPPPIGGAFVPFAAGDGLRADYPTPKGWYDPRHYGVTFDGVTNDLAAFQAFLDDVIPDKGGRVHLPHDGTAYLSDTLHINKPIHLVGHGGSQQNQTSFEVAPGRTCLSVDVAVIGGTSTSAAGCRIERISLKSRILVHSSATGSDLGLGLRVWTSEGTVRNGDLYTAASEASPTKCFRAGSAGTFGSVEPAWNTTPGATTVHNGITFTCETIPAVRQNSTAYVVGDRVYADQDNRYVWVCTVAGTSDSTPPSQLNGAVVGWGNSEILGTIADGGVTWQTTIAAGVYVNANLLELNWLYALGFTGAAVHLQGGLGMDARGTTNVDNARLRELWAEYCGLGVYLGGSDCNGWTINGVFGIDLGVLQPTPDIAAGAAYSGLGGHVLHDHSDASGRVSDLYGQISSGRPILKTGNGFMTALSCWTELTDVSHFEGGRSYILGGSIFPDDDSVSVWWANPTAGGRGGREVDPNSPVGLAAQLIPLYDNAALAFWTDDEATNIFAWFYEYGVPTGWYGFAYGNQGYKRAAALSSTGAGYDPGPGWWAFPDGYLMGDPQSVDPIAVAPYARIGWNRLRQGQRYSGDRFQSDTVDLILTSDGYRGLPWAANTAYTAAHSGWKIAAHLVEPTANSGLPGGGEQVWICTTSGTSHSTTEPTWPGSPTPGVTTQSDGTVTWTYLGETPSYEVRQRLTPKGTESRRIVRTQTTTAGLGQVIVDGAASDGINLALPPNSMTIVRDVISLKKASTGDGGSITVESTWVRNGTGAPAEIGTHAPAYNLSGTSLDATTVAHAANGNCIELQANPESADTLNWTVFRTQNVGID